MRGPRGVDRSGLQPLLPSCVRSQSAGRPGVLLSCGGDWAGKHGVPMWFYDNSETPLPHAHTHIQISNKLARHTDAQRHAGLHAHTETTSKHIHRQGGTRARNTGMHTGTDMQTQTRTQRHASRHAGTHTRDTGMQRHRHTLTDTCTQAPSRPPWLWGVGAEGSCRPSGFCLRGLKSPPRFSPSLWRPP